MEPVRVVLAGLMLTAGAAAAVHCVGCSCEDSQPPPRVVVRQESEQPARPAQQAPASSQPAQAAPARRPGESVIHGPADYLRATTINTPRYIKRKLRFAQTQNEIKQFEAMQGRYPLSLKELEQWRGAPLEEVPSGYTYKYDSQTGELDVVPIP